MIHFFDSGTILYRLYTILYCIDNIVKTASTMSIVYTHRGSRFDWCVGLSYLIQKMRESSPLKTTSPISIV
jgi:hypothetical protein